jgi:hypothetical protein
MQIASNGDFQEAEMIRLEIMHGDPQISPA